MANTIELTAKEWKPIRVRIKDEYPLSYLLISSVSKRELGFTVRLHREYENDIGYKETVCLDFYDDHKETLFRLKYL